MRLRFESLLDPTVPAELLTGLVGGRLKLTGRLRPIVSPTNVARCCAPSSSTTTVP
jgi:hypothetical protein